MDHSWGEGRDPLIPTGTRNRRAGCTFSTPFGLSVSIKIVDTERRGCFVFKELISSPTKSDLPKPHFLLQKFLVQQ